MCMKIQRNGKRDRERKKRIKYTKMKKGHYSLCVNKTQRRMIIVPVRHTTI